MKETVPVARPGSGAFAVRLGVAIAAILLLAMFILLGRVALQQSATIKSLEEGPVVPERSETESVPPTLPPTN
jgi:hypothetical protein